MINQISTKTRFGWLSAFENHGKIFKIKFPAKRVISKKS